jgi:hypothetical protein
MSLQISSDNSIIIDYKDVGLKLVQNREGTVIYKPENKSTGQKYEKVSMPHGRYSTSHDVPSSGAAGRAQLEADILQVL